MKIMVWFWGRHGGGSRYAFEVARALSARSDIETCVTISAGNELQAKFLSLPCDVRSFDTYDGLGSFVHRSLSLPKLRRLFAEHVRSQKADIVLSCMSSPWSAPMAGAVRQGGAKLISVMHDAHKHPGELNPLYEFRLRYECAAASGIVTLSDYVKRRLIADYGFPANKIAVVPLQAFTFDRFVPARRRFPTGRPFRYLFFGRLLAYKAIGVLLEAFRRVAQERPDVELHIFGKGNLSAHQHLLRELPRVTVTNDWIDEDDIDRLFGETDALLASHSEASQSGMISDAYGHAMPVIATPVGGLREQVSDGMTGILATDSSASALAAAMLRLLDPTLYEICAEGAFARSQDDWQQTGQKLVDYCRAVSAGVA